MKLSEIMEELEKIAPFELQENWDNSGLQIGNFSDEVSEIVLSLDIDDDVINSTSENGLIITHHPLIFRGIKSLNFSNYPSNIVQKLILKNIKLVSLHTNFDKEVLNQYVLEKVLNFEIFEKLDDFILTAKVEMKKQDFINLIKKSFQVQHLKTSNLPEKIEKIALTTGAGASLLPKIYNKVDVFLTGDIKYHEAMESKSMNLGLIDIGHFESEIFFAEALQKLLPKFKTKIVNSKNPFQFE